MRWTLVILRILSVAYLLVVAPFAWFLRDGLGPDAVESHGWTAVMRTLDVFCVGWVALFTLLILLICKFQKKCPSNTPNNL